MQTSYYGPSDPSVPRKGKDENEREYRNRLRYEMKMTINVWARSPSPPSKKQKENNKSTASKNKDASAPISKSESDIAGNQKKSSLGKKRHVETKRISEADSSSDSSSTGSSESSSESSDSETSSDSSADNKKKRKHSSSKRKTHPKSKKSKGSSKSQSRSRKQTKDRKESHKKRRKSSSSSSSSSDSDPESDGDGAEGTTGNKTVVQPPVPVPTASQGPAQFDDYDQDEAALFRKEVQGSKLRGGGGGSSSGAAAGGDESEEEEQGPMPMVQPKDFHENKRVDYGGALMPGEGDAIAQFVQQNMRIPRRGEIGWKGEEIDVLEGQGFVMSGSRHARMNAIRLRKENQVYSAEEKRALALITFEEKQQKENKVVGDFRAMLTKRLGPTGGVDEGENDE